MWTLALLHLLPQGRSFRLLGRRRTLTSQMSGLRRASSWQLRMRWEKESAARVANEVAEIAGNLKRVSLDAEEAVLKVRAKSLETELVAKKVEKDLLVRTTQGRKQEKSGSQQRMRLLRGADVAKPEKAAKL